MRLEGVEPSMTASPDPATDPGLFGPASVTWRVHADPLLGLAGLRALLLQALHPVAMAGVAAHSDFREDPWGRLVRTADYVATVSYAGTADAQRALARVRGVHHGVRGVDSGTGRAYRASDPDLLLWVHACLVDSFLDVVRRGGLRLTAREADAYVAEQVRLAVALGVPAQLVPDDVRRLGSYFDDMRPQLRATDDARDAARLVLLPPMPVALQVVTPARPAWAAMAALAFATLPRWARQAYRLPTPGGLDSLSGLVTGLGTTAALRALRASLLAVPDAVREGPHVRAARARMARAEAQAGDPTPRVSAR